MTVTLLISMHSQVHKSNIVTADTITGVWEPLSIVLSLDTAAPFCKRGVVLFILYGRVMATLITEQHNVIVLLS